MSTCRPKSDFDLVEVKILSTVESIVIFRRFLETFRNRFCERILHCKQQCFTAWSL